MKKIVFDIFALCTMAVISVSQVAKAAEMDEKYYKAAADGTVLENRIYDDENNTRMLPLREVSEAIGFNVEWNDEEKSCIVGSEYFPSVKLYIGEDKYIYGADAVAELGTAPVIKEGKTYVPEKFFDELLPVSVTDDENRTINISSKPEVYLDENETKTVKAGGLFAVTMEQNVTTGYCWTVEKDDSVKLLAEKAVDTQTDEMITGAPQIRTWIFKCDVPGEYTIKYTYERTFEENSAVRTAEYKLIVE